MQWASCGLNKAIWDPWFLVPIMNYLLKRLETKFCIGDQLLPVPRFFSTPFIVALYGSWFFSIFIGNFCNTLFEFSVQFFMGGRKHGSAVEAYGKIWCRNCMGLRHLYLIFVNKEWHLLVNHPSKEMHGISFNEVSQFTNCSQFKKNCLCRIYAMCEGYDWYILSH